MLFDTCNRARGYLPLVELSFAGVDEENFDDCAADLVFGDFCVNSGFLYCASDFDFIELLHPLFSLAAQRSIYKKPQLNGRPNSGNKEHAEN